MTVAFPKELRDFANQLMHLGFNVVPLEGAKSYDALIYTHSDANSFLSNIHPLREILFLDVTNITPKDASVILDSGLYSPLF
jgi:hypothetical protein